MFIKTSILRTNFAQKLAATPKHRTFFLNLSIFTFHKAASAGRSRQPAAGRTGGVRAGDTSRPVAAAPGQPMLHFREAKMSHSRSRLTEQKSSGIGTKLQISASRTNRRWRRITWRTSGGISGYKKLYCWKLKLQHRCSLFPSGCTDIGPISGYPSE